MAVTRDSISQAQEEWVTEIYYGTYKDRRQASLYERINKVSQSKRAFEEKFYVSGVGSYYQKGEGGAIRFDDIVQGNRTRITMFTYALGVRIPMEATEDDRHDVIAKLPEELAYSGMEHMERLGHDVWNNAFASTTYAAIDGAALCTTSHTAALKSGIVRSNLSTNDLSHAGIEAALVAMSQLTDEQGHFIPMQPDTLLIHVSKKYEIRRLLESQLHPYTADNEINTLNNQGLAVIATPYLTSTDDWFLFDSQKLDVRFWKRKGLTPNTSTDDITLDMILTSHYRAGVGVWNWEAVYGNNVP